MISELQNIGQLELTTIALLLILCSISIIQIWAHNRPGNFREFTANLDGWVTLILVALAIIAFTRGNFKDAGIFLTMALVSYYLYRSRGGGGKPDSKKSIFGKYAPW